MEKPFVSSSYQVLNMPPRADRASPTSMNPAMWINLRTFLLLFMGLPAASIPHLGDVCIPPVPLEEY